MHRLIRRAAIALLFASAPLYADDADGLAELRETLNEHVLGYFTYEMCIGDAQELQKRLSAACEDGSTALEGWTVRPIELVNCHSATLLTSATGAHYYVDTRMLPWQGLVASEIRMVPVPGVANAWWPQTFDDQNKMAHVIGVCTEKALLDIALQVPAAEATPLGEALVGTFRLDGDYFGTPPHTTPFVVQCPAPDAPPMAIDVKTCVLPIEDDPSVIDVVVSNDPNEKYGEPGFGAAMYVTATQRLPFLITFENLESATAAAQEVIVQDQLDPALDWSSVSLGPITFADRVVVPPPGVHTYATDVDLRPGTDLLVRIQAELDLGTGALEWRFTSIDPATGELTADPLAGFLPPNVVPPEGEGAVVFDVNLIAGATTGTEVRNSASIVFDTNAAIPTGEWRNTVDATAPTSAVNNLATVQLDTTFDVSWTGSDEGAGITQYAIYVSEDDGPFGLWMETSDTSASFTGVRGVEYGFYSVARDGAGLIELAPDLADTYTMIAVDADEDGVPDGLDNCTVVDNPDQRDTNNDGIGNVCDPDVDGAPNCFVNFLDLNVYRTNFFMAGDLDTDNNGDGFTNFLDLSIVRNYFFGQPGPSANGCN